MKKNQLSKHKTDTIRIKEVMLYLLLTLMNKQHTCIPEAMKLFDNLMKHEVDLADVESGENVKNIVQLLDAKLEDTSKRTEPQNCEL